jgi:glycosyltransferase involved in cell wall biosynthesis
MRLLIWGHYSATGFGTVTVELANRFLAAGLDVRVLAVNHRGEPVKGPLAGRVWPAGIFGDDYGGNVSAEVIGGGFWRRLDPLDDWKPDAGLVISDMTGLLSHIGQATPDKLTAWRSIPILHYCPIEGDNLTPAWRDVWGLIQPVAMSDYGQRVISAHIGRYVPRIYHGVDTQVFRPVSLRDPVIVDGRRLGTKDACKDYFGLAGRKVILRADRNAVRKFYPALIEAFVPIALADPEVDLILHCAANDPLGSDLIGELMRMPPEIRDNKRVQFTGMTDTFVGLSTDKLVALYNAADLYMTTTGGEGFGLTLAESLACEVPVVSSDWAAEAEVIGPGGVMIPPLHDSYGEPVRYHSTYGMDWAVPDPKGFVEPVLGLLAKPARRREMGAAGRRHVERSFNWDLATAEFLALLEEPHARANAV